jgi:4-hydroxybenzoate polyprenyltransferase
MGFSFIFVGGLLSRALRSPMPTVETAILAINVMIVGFLCNYIFDIANQASSPEEDVLNKPNRPIPAGLISIDQAKTRWLLAWTLGPLFIYFFFGVWATIHLFHFQSIIFVCYVWPRWYSWLMRNYFAASSYFILARLLNQVLAKTTPNWNMSPRIDFIIFVFLLGSVQIQEFYDLEGDRKSDRKTLPMLLSDRGLKILRVGTSIFIFAFCTGLSIIAYKNVIHDNLVASSCVLQQLSSCVLAYRIWSSKSVEMDRATYHVYYYPTNFAILLLLVLVTK